jgi:cytoskeleton protein RodZ
MLIGWAQLDFHWRKDVQTTPTVRRIHGEQKQTRPVSSTDTAKRLVPESNPAPAAVRAVLTAKEPVWVSIKADSLEIFTGILDVQETRQSDAVGELTILVGNAGGLDISVNGKPMGPIGVHGQVRLLQLTAEGVRFLRPTTVSRADLGGTPPRTPAF